MLNKPIEGVHDTLPVFFGELLDYAESWGLALTLILPLLKTNTAIVGPDFTTMVAMVYAILES